MSTTVAGSGSRNLRRIQIAAAVVLVAVASGACGGDDRGSLDEALQGGDAAEPVDEGVVDGTGDFEGSLEADRPASREIELAAGEALRVWVRPLPGGEGPDGEDDVAEISLAVAATPSLDAALRGAGYYDDEDSFFSDYDITQFFSEYGDTVNPSDYGVLLMRTAYYPTDGSTSYEPPWYSCYGRGWGDAAAQGTWLTLVAPVAGTYSLLVSGRGPYEIHLDTQDAPDQLTATTVDEFDTGAQPQAAAPVLGDAWQSVLDAHHDFLFDSGGDFFPSEGFFTDYEARQRPYGPDVAEYC